MTEHSAGSRISNTVRYSRVIGVPWAIAIGLTISVGLGVFTLMGVFVRAGARNLVGAFLLALVVALPFLATYAERALVVPGRQGVYSLARTGNLLWHRFMTGWLLLGGYAVLIALLGFGMSLYLQLLLDAVLGVDTIGVRLLTVLVIGVGAPAMLYLAGAQWRWRILLVVSATTFAALIVILRAWESNVTVSAETLFNMRTNILRLGAYIGGTYWGMLLLVDMRARVRRPLKTLGPSLLAVLVIGAGLGMLVGWVLLKTPAAMVHRDVPLYGIIVASQAFGQTGLWVLALIVFGVGINLLGITQVLLSGARLLHSMTEDGFVPASARFLSARQVPTGATVLVGSVAGAILFLLLSSTALTALAALLFFWVSFMIHVPDLFRAQPNLAPSRRVKLPFHPLLPGIVVVISLLSTLMLDEGVLYGLIWLALGTVAYLAYGRAHGAAVRRRQSVVAEDGGAAQAAAPYRVMVCVSNPDTALDLVRFGQMLARARGGEVLVLRVLVSRTSLTTHPEREEADEQYRFMAAVLAGLDDDGPEPRPIVRLAPSLAGGMLESIREEACDLVLLGGGGRFNNNKPAGDNVLTELLSYAPCDVAILHGTFAPEQGRVLVATAGGRHAGFGFTLAQSLCAEAGCQVRVITVADNARDDADELAEDALRTCMGDAFAPAAVLRPPGDARSPDEGAAGDGEAGTQDGSTPDGPIVAEIVHAASVSSGIMDAAEDADLLIIGASSTSMLERPVYDGQAVDLATENAGPTLMVRRKLARRSLELDRAVDRFVQSLPTLSDTRRTDVVTQMRQAAVPSVDFFVLIVLSAVIASFGLMQNSAAVIIGAMLVAPLMSPILAVAMGMVVGEFDIITSAIEATLKGVVLAVIVGIFAVIVSPIAAPTSEILARTEPNLLDLMVALASGAAAGYALSRKEVAAALPGVAIAAALVPPLCVVGYSIGTANLADAGGAMLLFVTNLVAIVFSAAVTFMLLGFHPPRAERGELIRSLRLTVLSLLVILGVLGFATYVSVRESNRRAAVQEVFDDYARQRLAVVSDFEIARTDAGFTIDAALVHYDARRIDGDSLDTMRADLEAAIGAPVELETTMVDAAMLAISRANREADVLQAVRRSLGELGVTVADSWAEPHSTELVVRAVVYAAPGYALSEEDVEAVNADLTARFRRPVVLSLTVLPAEFVGATPTPLPPAE